jgi:hypothetical protein
MAERSDDDTISRSDEYREIAANLRQGVVLLWEAFKAYFAISAILLTAFSFLQSGSTSKVALSNDDRRHLSLVVAAIGMLISALGPFAIARFVAYQQAFLDRGRSLEPKGGVMHKSLSVWGSGVANAPLLTIVVFVAFGLLWLVAAIVVLPRRWFAW